MEIYWVVRDTCVADKGLVLIYGPGSLSEISLLVAFATVSDLNTFAAGPIATCAVAMLL
jgi:hypothetical protein